MMKFMILLDELDIEKDELLVVSRETTISWKKYN